MISIIMAAFVTVMFTGCDALDYATNILGDTVDAVVMEDAAEVESISTDKYAYATLSDEAKTCYDQILSCILSFEEAVTLSTTDEDVIAPVVEAIYADYGGLFWTDGYSYKSYSRGDTITGIAFSPNYTMTKEEKEKKQAAVDDVVEQWLSELPADADDYAKSKFVFETLIDRVDYNTESEDNQNILSVFLNGESVCQGYADATAYLLEQLGVPATIVSGRANNETHAWNLVRLDGDYYFIDTTWGNSRYLDGTDMPVKHVNYAYLNVTSEELSSNHTIEMSFDVPECVATEDNYYRREGLCFDSMDVAAIGKIFADGYYGVADTSSVKMTGSSLYTEMKTYFIDNGHMADFCNGLKSVTYMESLETGVLTVIWEN